MRRRPPMVRINGRGDALLVIDVINDLEFPGADKVLPWAKRLAPLLYSVREKLRAAGVPVIYVNDNFGLWRGYPGDVFEHCMRRDARGRAVSRALKPGPDDYVILKPRHSAFFGTPLSSLLEHLGVERLILAGMATNLCVLASAHDAAMLGYEIIVLSDCCAAESDFDHNTVLNQLKRFFDATICRSTELGVRSRRSRRR